MSKDRPSSDEREVDVRCGYGRYKPDCLQIFNNPKSMLFALCFMVTAQGKRLTAAH